MTKKNLLSLLLILWLSPFAFGLTTNDITYTLLSGDQLFTDQNNCAVDGPKANYLQVLITNVSGLAQNNLAVQLNSFSNPTQFSLAGGQSSAQIIPYLGIGASDTLYWFIQYPPCSSTPTSTISFLTTDLDDNTTASGLLKKPNNTTATLVVGGLISANATGNAAPPIVTRNDGQIGGIISIKVRYDFNTISTNGQIWFQPVGNLSFNAAAFQLINSRISSYVDPAFMPCMLPTTPLDFACKLNYIASCSNNGNSNKYFYTEYDFRILQHASTFLAPYTTGLSGNPYKYTYNASFGVALNSLVALPLTLLDFKVNAIDNGNLISWTTENEREVLMFGVERTFDGLMYEKIAEIAAKGGTNLIQTYEYTDKEVPISACYRLTEKSVDGSNRIHVDNCIQMQVKGLVVKAVYPTPASNELNITFYPSELAENVTFTLFDLQGKIIHQYKQPVSVGENTQTFSLDSYETGSYWVKVNDGFSTPVVRQFIKL